MKSSKPKNKPDAFPHQDSTPGGDGVPVDLPPVPLACFATASRAPVGTRVALVPVVGGWSVTAGAQALGVLAAHHGAAVEAAGRAGTVATSDDDQTCLTLG